MDVAAMLAVLADVRELLARPDNDYNWSSFMDAEAALEELDGLVAQVEATGRVPWTLGVLFAATGPIQEVAISSGWGESFLLVAERFDEACLDSQ